MSHGHGPPPEQEIRERETRVIDGRDVTPAVGRRGEPGRWRRAIPNARVRGFTQRFEDGRWSFLYRDPGYAAAPDDVAAAAQRMRAGEDVPVPVKGPIIRPNVWTWEVPLYFWFGGIASGASFTGLAAELVGDERAARVARLVAVGAAATGGPLLIMDLGRPERFLHMFRIFKTRSPMSMGAWCLMGFMNAGGAAVAADLFGHRRTARGLTAASAALGTYLGSYTGVLLASTAVPVWNQSRSFLPPIFICTATASGAAAVRLALPSDDPTSRGLAALEKLAMSGELVLSALNERRLGVAGRALEHSRGLKLARALTLAGLAARGRVASGLFLAAALAYRYGWVAAGRHSALDHDAVATLARRRV